MFNANSVCVHKEILIQSTKNATISIDQWFFNGNDQGQMVKRNLMKQCWWSVACSSAKFFGTSRDHCHSFSASGYRRYIYSKIVYSPYHKSKIKVDVAQLCSEKTCTTIGESNLFIYKLAMYVRKQCDSSICKVNPSFSDPWID